MMKTLLIKRHDHSCQDGAIFCSGSRGPGGILRVLLILSMGAIYLQCGGGNPSEPKTYPAPVITVNPAVNEITDTGVLITWETDLESSTVVRYGLFTGQHIYRDSSSTEQTKHTTRLTSLRSNTTYYYYVQSTSTGGTVRSAEASFKTGLGVQDLGPAAWLEYEGGRIRSSIDLFRQLQAKLPTSFDASNGLGWCCADVSVDSLSAATTYFTNALSQKANFSDAFAGRGFVGLALKKYSQVIEDLTRVLEINPNYVFAHKSKVNARAVRIGLAEAYFYNQAFVSAQTQVTILAPENGLVSGNPATWVVDGKTYASYAEALLAWIEKLKV